MFTKFKNLFTDLRTSGKGLAVFFAAIVVILVVILVAAGVISLPNRAKRTDTGGTNIASAMDAQDAARSVALRWHSDALLSSANSNLISGAGEPINSWQFIFISPSAPGKGLVVKVDGTRAEAAGEISYTGTAAPLPENIISQGEAVRRVHEMKGYESEPVLGIEAVYDTTKGSWFWAVKTAKGTVSVQANQ